MCESVKILFYFVLQSSYLMKFGYLPELDLVAGNLRSEEQLKDALRTLQVKS